MKLDAQVAKLGIAAVLKTASRKGAQVRILPWASFPRIDARSVLSEGDSAYAERPRRGRTGRAFRERRAAFSATLASMMRVTRSAGMGRAGVNR